MRERERGGGGGGGGERESKKRDIWSLRSKADVHVP
jgi:hypothetical protein